MNPQKYIIVDFYNNHWFTERTFGSEEEALGFLCMELPDERGDYEDYFIVPIEELYPDEK